MQGFNPDTTWIGLLGGGVSGSLVGGGSVFQFDLWNMGSERLPVRALVTGKRVGLVAEVGTAMAALLVTGCRKGLEMDGITSSGIDWELAVGVKGSALAKTGSKFFKEMAARAAANGVKAAAVNWAADESSKRFVQWAMNDLGVVKSGKQFNLIPYPLAIGAGAGVFYEWQTLNLLKGKVAWQHISPKWNVFNSNGDVLLSMMDIPEQDGTRIKLGFGVDKAGFDPNVRWKKLKGPGSVDSRNKIQISGYVYGGTLFERPDGMGIGGINLSNYQPIGRSEAGLLTVDRTDTVAKNQTLTLYPQVFEFGNYPYWSASDRMKVQVDGNGIIKTVEGTSDLRD